MRTLLLTFICITAMGARQPEWMMGSLVMHDGEVIVGEISIQPEFGVVLVKNETGSAFVSTNNVHRVYAYDAKAGINRKFLVIGNKETSELLEIVADGEVIIVRRKGPFISTGNLRYYLLINGTMLPMTRFHSDVLPQLSNKLPGLEKVIKSERWKSRELIGAVMIVKYYNKRINEQAPTSAAPSSF